MSWFSKSPEIYFSVFLTLDPVGFILVNADVDRVYRSNL